MNATVLRCGQNVLNDFFFFFETQIIWPLINSLTKYQNSHFVNQILEKISVFFNFSENINKMVYRTFLI